MSDSTSSFNDETPTEMDASELTILESALARSVEDRLESNTSAIAAALQLRSNLIYEQ